MDEDTLRRLLRALSKMAEQSAATDDILALLCSYFASTSHRQAIAFAESLKRIRESDEVRKTASFAALAQRIELSLRHDQTVSYYSLTESAPMPEALQELKDWLAQAPNRKPH